MADNKSTDLHEEHSRQDFPEASGKTVEIVELATAPDYYAITIRFQDKTSLNFRIEPCAVTFPVYSDWASGEEKQLKRHQPILNGGPSGRKSG